MIRVNQIKKYGKRTAIEPTIVHSKKVDRLNGKYLNGDASDYINVLLASAAVNFKLVMNLLKKDGNQIRKLLDDFMLNVPWDCIAQHLKLKF